MTGCEILQRLRYLFSSLTEVNNMFLNSDALAM